VADYEREAAFVAEHRLTDSEDEIYVNGDSRIPGACSPDPISKERMFATVEASMNNQIMFPKEQIAEFCRRHHIRRLAVFGSALREDFGLESDIDFLVEFDSAFIPTLFDIAAMETELSEIIGGRKVDLRTPEDLSRYFRDKVLAEAEVQYAA